MRPSARVFAAMSRARARIAQPSSAGQTGPSPFACRFTYGRMAAQVQFPCDAMTTIYLSVREPVWPAACARACERLRFRVLAHAHARNYCANKLMIFKLFYSSRSRLAGTKMAHVLHVCTHGLDTLIATAVAAAQTARAGRAGFVGLLPIILQMICGRARDAGRSMFCCPIRECPSRQCPHPNTKIMGDLYVINIRSLLCVCVYVCNLMWRVVVVFF